MIHQLHIAALLLSACLFTNGAQAQLGDRVRGWLNGTPEYDTSYVALQRDLWTVSLVSRLQNVDIELSRPDGVPLEYATNNNVRYGFGLNHRWLGLEFTFDVPALSVPDTALGQTTSRGFGLGFTGKRVWAHAMTNSTQGFHLATPQQWLAGWEPGDPTLLRGDLRSTTHLLSINYALSGKDRFSQNAAMFQIDVQRRSTGTFLAGFSGWHTRISADSSLISPAQVDSFALAHGFSGVQRTLLGATFGYAHTFVVNGLFLHLAMLPGVGWTQQRVEVDEATDITWNSAGAISEFRLGFGYSDDRWFAAVTGNYHFSSTDIADGIGLTTTHGDVRLALGYRFSLKSSRTLEQLGL